MPRAYSFSPALICSLIFSLILIVAWSVGGAAVHPWDLFSPKPIDEMVPYILLEVRLPRLAAACLVGSCLGAAGSLTQGVFRNPLASPSVLGVSSGGILCVVMSLYWQWTEDAPWIIAPMAFIGCLLTLTLLLKLLRSTRPYSTEEILLIGLSLSSILSSLTTLFLSFSLTESDKALNLMNWMLGTLAGKTWTDTLWALPTAVAGLILAFRLRYQLNVLATGTDQSQALGLPIDRLKRLSIIAISLLVASSVAIGGLLPFVGLIVPHISRIFSGPDNKKLLPLSILNGMTLVLLTDLIARTINPPLEIQVGVIVSLIGSPFFLWLLVKKQENASFTMNILQAQSITLKLSGTCILNAVSCTIPRSKNTVILGPNGAGKTMLLRCLAGLQSPDEGSVHWIENGRTTTYSQAALAHHRAWVPLSQILPFDFTVHELIVMSRFPHHKGYPGLQDSHKASEALCLLGIEHLQTRLYNTLSRGEQTKVDIAKAIAQEVSVIFLDEPFANLDIDAKLQLFDVFDFLRSAGKTLILSHHDLHSVSRIADFIIFLQAGQVISQGSLEEMFQESWLEKVFHVKVKLNKIEGSQDLALSFAPQSLKA